MNPERTYPHYDPYFRNDKGKYWVRVTWAPGDYTRHSLGCNTAAGLAEALALFQQLKVPELLACRANAAAPSKPSSKSEIARAIDWFLKTYLRTKRRQDHTIAGYTHILESFREYAAALDVHTANEITTRLIQEWQIERVNARRTGDTQSGQRDELMKLRKFLGEAQASGEIALRSFITVVSETGDKKQVPAIKWDIPGKPKSKRFQPIADAELKRYINDLENEIARDTRHARLAMALLWMIGTPWLPSDTIDFRIHEDHGDVIDRERIKTSREICYPVTPDLRRIIEMATQGRKLKPDDRVFIRHDKRIWTKTQFEDRFRDWADARGYTFCFRDMRVTWATNMAPLCQPNELAELMGVEDVTTVYKYYVRVDISKMALAQKRHAARITAVRTGEQLDTTIIPYILPRKARR